MLNKVRVLHMITKLSLQSWLTKRPFWLLWLMNRNNLWTNSILDALCTFLNSQEQKWGELLGGRACRCWGQKIKSGSTSYGNFFLQEVIAHTKQSTAFAILFVRWIRMIGMAKDITIIFGYGQVTVSDPVANSHLCMLLGRINSWPYKKS